MTKTRICLCLMLWALRLVWTPSVSFAQQKTFETDAVSIRKALVNGEISQALDYYEELAQERERATSAAGSGKTDWKKLSAAYTAAARAARYKGELQKALDYSHRSLDAATRAADPYSQLRAIDRIIFGYRDIGNGEKAKKFIDHGFEIIDTLPEGSGGRLEESSDLYVDLATYFRALQQYDKALRTYEKSLSLREQHMAMLEASTDSRDKATIRNDKANVIYLLQQIGGTYRLADKPETAMLFYRRALEAIDRWQLDSHHTRQI